MNMSDAICEALELLDDPEVAAIYPKGDVVLMRLNLQIALRVALSLPDDTAYAALSTITPSQN